MPLLQYTFGTVNDQIFISCIAMDEPCQPGTTIFHKLLSLWNKLVVLLDMRQMTQLYGEYEWAI